MSVINKMLRDLDARRADGALPDLAREVRSTAMQGTSSVGDARHRGRRHWWLVPLVLVLVAGAAAWYWTMLTPAATPGPVVVAPPSQAAMAPQSPASAPEVAAASAETTPAQAAAPLPDRMAEPVAAAPKVAAPPRANAARKPESAAAARTAPEKKQAQRPGRTAVAATAPATTATPAPAPSVLPAPDAPVAPVLPAARRQPAVQETLAQAQSLWAAGSYDAAVALLREAVVVAGAAPDAQAQLPVVARELARMELALGRSGAALDLLTRLEPQLASHADLWAMRGNAAQRLGRHAESVQAYQRALQLRPAEQRWLLGAAVSLAALGQADTAAQYAEQARALGPVSAEVLAYLRQAGVPLR